MYWHVQAPKRGDALDLLHEQVHDGAQVAALAQVGARSQGRARGVVMDEGARVHDGDQGIQVDAVHERVARRNRLVELVPDVLRLRHARILQHKST